MKLSMKFLAIAALLFTINFGAQAQESHREMKEKPSPMMVAQNQTDRMSQEIDLSELQVKQVKKINLTYAEKMTTIHEENQGNGEALKASKEALKTQRTAAIQEVLTAQQFASFYEMKGKGKSMNKGNKKGKCKSTCKSKTAKI